MIENNLICVDGADGAGSTTITKALTLALNQRGFNTHFVEIPAVSSPSGLRAAISDIENRTHPNLEDWQGVGYAGVCREAYESDVKPRLLRGGVIVVNSGVGKILMHAAEDCNLHLVSPWCKSGVITSGVQPLLRVLVTAPENIVLKVMKHRKDHGSSDRYDPEPTLDAVRIRLAAFQLAYDILMTEDGATEENHFLVNNDRNELPKLIAEKLTDQYIKLLPR